MERRFTVEAEIEILKHEISVLKEMCKDLRFTMHVQDNVKKIEAAQKNELARKTKTVKSQELEICPARQDNKPHSWATKTRSTRYSSTWWVGCVFCCEKKLDSDQSVR
jgi:hypothetical protein